MRDLRGSLFSGYGQTDYVLMNNYCNKKQHPAGVPQRVLFAVIRLITSWAVWFYFGGVIQTSASGWGGWVGAGV